MKRFLSQFLPFSFPLTAYAAAAAVTGTPADGLIVMAITFMTGPFTLLILIGGLVFLCLKILKGREWGEHAARYVVVCTLLAGGIQLIVRIFGGNLVTSVLA